jgi:hypothetical protein
MLPPTYFACAISALTSHILLGASLPLLRSIQGNFAGENHICGKKTNGSLACSGTASVIVSRIHAAICTTTPICSGNDYSCLKIHPTA